MTKRMIQTYDPTKSGERFMSKLVVIAYDDQFRAEEVRTTLRKLQQSHLIDIERGARRGQGRSRAR
jgi:hypothetical protein